MTLSRLFAFIALIFMGFSAPAQAQSTGYYGSNNAYQFGGQPGSFGYSNPGSTTVFDLGFQNTGGLNILGCGGIGAFNFMNTTFNMSNIIDQLTKNMETMLAKQLLIQAMSIPQVAAIFDTLNAFGNAKFSLFNQSCNLSSIKKEARAKAIQSCRDQHQGDTAAQNQCQTDFDQDANFAKNIASAFSNICGFENFNKSLGDMVRKDDNGNATGSSAFMALIPQYRLNLSGSGATGSNAKAMCQTNSSYYGVKSAALPLQAAADAVRSVSDIYIGKAQSQVEAARGAGISCAALKNASAKVDALCAANDPKCKPNTTTTAALTDPASPGFVHLANIDLKQAGFADSISVSPVNNSDAALADFKKRYSCGDATTTNADPLLKARVMAQVLQEDNPGVSLPTLDLTDQDATNFTKNLNFNVSGDTTASSQLAIDAKAATTMLQIAATCAMSKQLKIDNDKIVDLTCNQGPACATAYRNGLGAQVTHIALLQVYSFMKDFAHNAETAIISKQAQPTTSSGATNTDTTTDNTMTADTQQKYLTTLRQAQATLDNNIVWENNAYNTMQQSSKLFSNSTACRERTTLPPSDFVDQ